MKVLIFEGIATSGKSTITDKLKTLLSDMQIKIASEAETLMPIINETDDKHVEFFKSLVAKSVAEDVDVLIFDRLYLTQAFRAKCELGEYVEVENLLKPYSPTIIFLKVDEAVIPDRIAKATQHRDPAWGEYVRSKGETMREVSEYYIGQQQSLLVLLEQSTIPYKIFDTTQHNYQNIVDEIVALIKQN